MKPEIEQERNRSRQQHQEQYPSGACKSFNFIASLVASNSLVLECQQGKTRDHRRGSHVEHALQDVHTKHMGNWNRIFLRDQYRTNRLARSTKQKSAGESHQSGAINVPKICMSKGPRKPHPSNGAYCEADVNRKYAQDKQRKTRVAEGLPYHPPMKSFQCDRIAELVK